jgi:hypothetical protein
VYVSDSSREFEALKVNLHDAIGVIMITTASACALQLAMDYFQGV